jgi:uncharacterized membrane protein YjfL (UPF0719 family)
MSFLLAQAGHSASLPESLLAVLAFGAVGILLALVGFKLFDWMTPGNLGAEITTKQNIAAAILAGAVILGVSIIIAASIHG